MKLIKRDPDRGYIDSMLWVPKKLLNVEGVKKALEFELPARDMIRVLRLWEEAEHHLIVPRAFWKPGDLQFECIDCRPTSFPKTKVRSKIRLDYKKGPGGLLQPTGKTTQSKAIDALLKANGGTLQLACVSGSTTIYLNRGGKGFKCTIADAVERSRVGTRYAWDPNIPTYIRAKKGDRIGLQRVEQIIYKGLRRTLTLELEDGKKLRLTDDHQVLTETGFRSIREGLTIGDLVYIDGARNSSVRKKKVAYRRIGGFNKHPFARYQTRTYVIEEHRAVAEAALNKLSLEEFKQRCGKRGNLKGLTFIDPHRYHVHHRDENIRNNALANLEVLEIEEHMAQHRPGAAAFGIGEPQLVAVKRISTGQLEPVYDVVCADPHHNFVANGVVVHNCGKGKTVVALHLASLLRVPTLIAVDNTQLLHQWQNEIALHLEVPGGVGLIQGQVRNWKHDVVMTTYQSLANWADMMPEEVRRWFGLVIWDEGHHVNAPTFSKSAPLFYGYRLALSATPNRTDGTQVICQHHVGDVIFKDIVQDHPPKIAFKWTGFELNLEDERVKRDVSDKNSEIHLGKLAGYFGANRERMTQIVIPEVQALVAKGHKVLVLSYSVDEVINLMTLWTANDPDAPLYSEIPYPTGAEVGAGIEPVELKPEYAKKLEHTLADIKRNLAMHPNLQPVKRQAFQAKADSYRELLDRFEVWKSTEKLYRKRQRDFLADLLAKKSSSGLFTEAVKPPERMKMLAERQVIFAIMKYGREGLDDSKLSAIVVCEPMSDPNTLQQIMGRPRDKKNSELIFLEDNIGPLIGQCQKLRRHLRDWPIDEGGPFKYEQVNHPSTFRRQGRPWEPMIRTPMTSKAMRVPGS